MSNVVLTLREGPGLFLGGAWIDLRPSEQRRGGWGLEDSHYATGPWVARAALHGGVALHLGPLTMGAGYGLNLVERSWRWQGAPGSSPASSSGDNGWRRGAFSSRSGPVLLLQLGDPNTGGLELVAGAGGWGLGLFTRH
ncbi:hypothetical protein [Ideonella livida]|uniref:Uncharacterized protein n=1 Tax=Ideonella livida TaxID=2707176 RepID=A0A7C9TP02_9BURK|nr:hypothetical protein [Ideonella livida]NDY93086.1 hypothetical protein [Ideonella livida]